LQFFKPPFFYDAEGGFVFDQNNNMVAEVRAWGLLQYEAIPDKLQDGLGESIAEGLNSITSRTRE
jgi:hypothetical protein